PQSRRERGLLGGRDVLLNRQRVALAACGPPVPRLPLHLDAAQRVGLELIADEIQSGLPVPDASKRRELRPILRAAEILLAIAASSAAIRSWSSAAAKKASSTCCRRPKSAVRRRACASARSARASATRGFSDGSTIR